MRIAGINSPNYYQQPNKPQNNHSSGHLVADDSSNRSGNIPESAPANASSQSPQHLKSATSQNDALLQPVTKHITRHGRDSEERMRSNNELPPKEVWNTYSRDGQAIPDNTSHKAKLAIGEYLQTQHLEDRAHFEQVLGIDDYA